ncbi:MAG: 2-amino-4-hydroxy-6-hydroxymethyldihydropteridine diphosphokinase [Burkholderiaceae bacterium]|nr:MAG: 2-amino-4-hydroxy-6-hydroxymethyldihydropteridine diphosphokinase [Burkholderiaceae bacterium]
MKHIAYLGLGANLDHATHTVQQAMTQLNGKEITVLAQSSLYRSAPVDARGPDFINAVVKVATTLTPAALLAAALQLEQQYGRTRAFRNAPRTLDIDLLLYDDLTLHEPGLTLPHPRLHERAFVLLPLLELDPHFVIPGRGAAENFLAHCAGQAIEKLP